MSSLSPWQYLLISLALIGLGIGIVCAFLHWRRESREDRAHENSYGHWPAPSFIPDPVDGFIPFVPVGRSFPTSQIHEAENKR